VRSCVGQGVGVEFYLRTAQACLTAELDRVRTLKATLKDQQKAANADEKNAAKRATRT
jgi:hypothetical protein